MDISDIGAQFLNSQYVPLSSSASPSLSPQMPGMLPGIGAANNGGFEAILKRTQEAQNRENQADTANAPVSGASQNAPIDKNSKLYGLCLDLETYLIKDMIKGMRDTVQKSNLIDTGFAGGMYEDMLYDEYAKNFAKNANFGFAEMAYRQLSGQR